MEEGLSDPARDVDNDARAKGVDQADLILDRAVVALRTLGGSASRQEECDEHEQSLHAHQDDRRRKKFRLLMLLLTLSIVVIRSEHVVRSAGPPRPGPGRRCSRNWPRRSRARPSGRWRCTRSIPGSPVCQWRDYAPPRSPW